MQIFVSTPLNSRLKPELTITQTIEYSTAIIAVLKRRPVKINLRDNTPKYSPWPPFLVFIIIMPIGFAVRTHTTNQTWPPGGVYIPHVRKAGNPPQPNSKKTRHRKIRATDSVWNTTVRLGDKLQVWVKLLCQRLDQHSSSSRSTWFVNKAVLHLTYISVARCSTSRPVSFFFGWKLNCFSLALFSRLCPRSWDWLYDLIWVKYPWN